MVTMTGLCFYKPPGYLDVGLDPTGASEVPREACNIAEPADNKGVNKGVRHKTCHGLSF